MRLSRRFAWGTLCVLLFVGFGLLTPASAICTVNHSCFNIPSGYCQALPCSHVRDTNTYWDYDCYPVPCCVQGHCVIWEIQPEAGSGCNWLCFQDNFAECSQFC